MSSLVSRVSWFGSDLLLYFVKLNVLLLAMPTCPRCHQAVRSQAVSCSSCGLVLKAYGHPGIPLHRSEDEAFLCDSCLYHVDGTCNYPQHPYARECTLYQNRYQVLPDLKPANYQPSFNQLLVLWLRRYSVWIVLVVLIIAILLWR